MGMLVIVTGMSGKFVMVLGMQMLVMVMNIIIQLVVMEGGLQSSYRCGIYKTKHVLPTQAKISCFKELNYIMLLTPPATTSQVGLL